MDLSEKVRVVGGIGTIWGKQFHQQNRLYDTKGVSPAINAYIANGLIVKKWKKSESDRQQMMD